MKYCFLLCLLLTLLCRPQAATLHVGAGYAYANLSQAVAAVQPGDTIEMHAGIYAGGLYFANLQGTAAQWITLRGAAGEEAVLQGGNNAVQLSDPAYLRIVGLIFRQQTGNGVNVDDGGSYSSPAHHIVFERCTFRDMNASGNNDLLKLSGLDHFEVRECRFLNGAAGGSGIDMVGCHYGLIRYNYFENQGSNSIQAKGGTAYVRMEGNTFVDGGQRTLNLGGSTGLQFFRPDTAHYEAAHLQVYANTFVGSWAPIAYVGSVHVEVVNNTFYAPENWVIRILQETVDTSRFLACGDNSFVNNIVYLDRLLNTETNIGPNTRPQSFTFSHNLWFQAASANWLGPKIPSPDAFQIVQADPLFLSPGDYSFQIQPHSPAAGRGKTVSDPAFDVLKRLYNQPRSIGAAEANPLSAVHEGTVAEAGWLISPNPCEGQVLLSGRLAQAGQVQAWLYDVAGRTIKYWQSGHYEAGQIQWMLALEMPLGLYWLRWQAGEAVVIRPVYVVGR